MSASASARACGAPHHHLRPPQAPLAAQRGLVPHVPEPVLVRSRPVTGWHLDERRLLEAVTTFAPDVRVLHLDRDGSVRPLEVPADRQTRVRGYLAGAGRGRGCSLDRPQPPVHPDRDLSGRSAGGGGCLRAGRRAPRRRRASRPVSCARPHGGPSAVHRLRSPRPATLAEEYGFLRAGTESVGHPVADNDLWIAACATTNGLSLATLNRRHFAPLTTFGLTLV
jgi:hypothetical protein